MMDKIYVRIGLKENPKKIDYTVRFVKFDPRKKFVGTPEAKDMARKDMHCSKDKMTNEYDSMYGQIIKVGRGKKAHWEFNISPKTEANVIFILPKSKKSHFRKILVNIEVPC